MATSGEKPASGSGGGVVPLSVIAPVSSSGAFVAGVPPEPPSSRPAEQPKKTIAAAAQMLRDIVSPRCTSPEIPAHRCERTLPAELSLDRRRQHVRHLLVRLQARVIVAAEPVGRVL